MQKRKVGIRGVFVILFVVGSSGLFAGCAATGAGSGDGDDPHRLTTEQVQEAADQHRTAFAIIEHLRPLWLRKRGRSSIMNETDIAVYVDGSRYGTPRDLRQISAIEVDSMRFLPPSEATNRYGTGHMHGIIMVRTKR